MRKLELKDFGIRDDYGGAAKLLPIRGEGEIHHVGWDIPTRWAIDKNGLAYMDNAHGHSLCLVTTSRLLAEAEEDPSAAMMIRKVLGIPEPSPTWIAAARAAGWTPPKGWKDP